MLTLGELKELERVCIIAREGTMKIYSQTVISLFEKVRKFHNFSHTSRYVLFLIDTYTFILQYLQSSY